MSSPSLPYLPRFAQEIARGLGGTIRRTAHGEFCARLNGSPAGEGYFTDSLMDATETLRRMRERANSQPLPNA